MKKSHIFSAAMALALAAGTSHAAALSVSAYLEGNANTGNQYQPINASTRVNANANAGDNHGAMNGDDHSDMNASARAMLDARVSTAMSHWKMWSFRDGIVGTVTAKTSDSITVKAANGTVYTVDTSDANVRTSNNSSVEVGDHVYIQGAVKDNSIVATLVIDGKAGTPNATNDDKRMAIAGAVTDQNGSTITIVGSNGTTYKVDAGSATFWKGGKQVSSASDIDAGDSIVVQGTISGSNVTATKVYAVTLPDENKNGDIRGTVTAVNDDSLTILVSGGTTYSVNTNDADFKDKKGSTESMSDVHIGEMITVDGDVNGSTIDANTVSEAKARAGLFVGIGNFFKHLFGKKQSQ